MQSYPTTPWGVPIHHSGPSKTGGTRVYLPQCWGELEVELYTAPPRGVPIPQMAQAGPEGIGFLCRCAGRSWKFNHTRPPHGASLSPKTDQARPEGLGCIRRWVQKS